MGLVSTRPHSGSRHVVAGGPWRLRVAARWLRGRFREVEAIPRAYASHVRISELIDHYQSNEVPLLAPSTRRSYGYSLVPIRWFFVDNLGDPLLDRVTSAHIRQYLGWRRTHAPDGSALDRPLSNRSVAKERGYLNRLFDIAERLEMCGRNPVTRIEVPRSDGRDPVISDVGGI